MTNLTQPYAYLGIGLYAPSDAARLLRTSPRNVRRWLQGYSYKRDDIQHYVPPLWEPGIKLESGDLELTFNDLIELRFVRAFVQAGLGLLTIRNCLEEARRASDRDYPFSIGRFRTDGHAIFLQSLEKSGEIRTLDLKRRQFAFGRVVERTFKDLDLDADTVIRWRPYRGKDSIIIDPTRSFGQPVATHYGIPTVALADAVQAEGSAERVAALFEVPVAVVRDALQFETEFLATCG